MKHGSIHSPNNFRRLLQSVITVYCLFIGWQFFIFLQFITGNGTEATRPASVEAFLPISALLGLKRLVLTGQWDPVHPAGLSFLLGALLMALLFRKGFCGYVCPVGFLSHGLEALGRRLGWAKVPHRKLDYVLSSLKYLLLLFFLNSVFLGMPLAAVEQFIRSPYNMTADARMLEFFLSPSGTSMIVMLVLAIGSVLIRNVWCRYLCPYGALLGIVSFFSPVAIRRDANSCIDCGKCTKTCPGAIRVESKTRVSSPECIGCSACIEACPVDECLTVNIGNERVPYWIIGAGAVSMLLAVWAAAELAGLWRSEIPEPMLRMFYLRNMTG